MLLAGGRQHNEIYFLIKYIKSILWRVAKCLSYKEEARYLMVNVCHPVASRSHSDTMQFLPHILTLTSTWGPCPPQPVSLLGPDSFPFPSFWLVQAVIEPNHFLSKHPNNLIPFIFPFTLPMKMEQIECSKMSAYKIQMSENHAKERIQHSEHGESVKSRKPLKFTSVVYFCRDFAWWWLWCLKHVAG